MVRKTAAPGGPSLIGVPEDAMLDELARRIVAKTKKEEEIAMPNNLSWPRIQAGERAWHTGFELVRKVRERMNEQEEASRFPRRPR